MDLTHKIESLRYDIENGVVTDVISISARLIQIKDQALQLQQKREHIKQYVKKWMDGHDPNTFVKNQHGNVIYSAGHSSLNLLAFFENLLEDYLDENGQ